MFPFDDVIMWCANRQAYHYLPSPVCGYTCYCKLQIRDLYHQYMMTSSNGNIFRVTGLLCGEFTCHRWIPLTKASDAGVWCYLWSPSQPNSWANNGDAGDLRHHRAHNEVILMMWKDTRMHHEVAQFRLLLAFHWQSYLMKEPISLRDTWLSVLFLKALYIGKFRVNHWLSSYHTICILPPHDDVIKWKHFPRYWPFVRGIHRSPVNSLHKGQWRGAFMFSLICAWIKLWAHNWEAGDLRRYRGHYDVIVMTKSSWDTVRKSELDWNMGII